MKPMLASDWDEAKLRFPLIAQPKIDGVRALNLTGKLTGRSLKQHKNVHVTTQFSHNLLVGFDGEMAAERETHADLCRLTSSALGTIEGRPFVLWWLFDYVVPTTLDLRYWERLVALEAALAIVRERRPDLWNHLRTMPSQRINYMDDLLAYDAANLEAGFEGTIVRDLDGLYKQGRSTVREGGLLRIKRFVDFEFRVTQVLEGEANQNEAQINELGQTFRTSHQENKVANGMVGAMIGVVIGEVKDTLGRVVLQDGQEVKVSAGRMTHAQRAMYFQHPHAIMEQISKGKFFPVGIKDKPRFPTWQSFRSKEDIS